MNGRDAMRSFVSEAQAADSRLRKLVSQMQHRLDQFSNAKIEADDPLVMAMAANLLIVEQAVQSTRDIQDEVLKAHRSELELLSARWQRDADAIGQRIVAQVLRATGEEAGQAAQRACGSTAVRIEEALEQHAQRMERMLWSSSAIVSFGMLAAACMVLFR